jgi:acyl-CoA thioesterase II
VTAARCARIAIEKAARSATAFVAARNSNHFGAGSYYALIMSEAGMIGEDNLPHRTVWGKPTADLPEDPLIHAAAMAYFSDSGLVATVGTAYGMWGPGGASASLDHAMWWHHPPRFNDWLLYVSDSPAAHAARGLIFAHMYNREGALVASVAQEGLFRRERGDQPQRR